MAVNSLSQLEAHNAGEVDGGDVREANWVIFYVSHLIKTGICASFASRFKAQDDAGGPERRRADQGLPSTRSKAEERQQLGIERLRPAEQNLPLSDL